MPHNEAQASRALESRLKRLAEKKLGKPEQAKTPEEAEANWNRATRRAIQETRRYIVSNRLQMMWVLTRLGGHGLHGPDGRAEMHRLAAKFAIALRTYLGAEVPYYYSAELHPGKHGKSTETCPIPDQCHCAGHGWHVNFFLRRKPTGRIMQIEVMKRLWQDVDAGNGYQMQYKDWLNDSRVEGKPFAQALRLGAAYATKYASKDWSPEMITRGRHRYELAQSFQPKGVKVTAESLEEMIGVIATQSAQWVEPMWCSLDSDDWTGPLCWVFQWSPPGMRAGP